MPQSSFERDGIRSSTHAYDHDDANSLLDCIYRWISNLFCSSSAANIDGTPWRWARGEEVEGGRKTARQALSPRFFRTLHRPASVSFFLRRDRSLHSVVRETIPLRIDYSNFFYSELLCAGTTKKSATPCKPRRTPAPKVH